MKHFFTNKQSGYLLIQALVFGAIGVMIIGALVSWGGGNLRTATQNTLREQAFHLAEAGTDYYRWHLAHAPQDFKDGTNNNGPYVHNYYDKDGDLLGTFTLTITPPPPGSTVVTILSEGQPTGSPVKRKIETKLAIPSLAKYAFVANAAMRFGEGTEVFGPVHSNDGVRFDGLAHNLVSSAKANYDDPDHSGGNEFGVHTHVNPPPGSGTNDSFRPAEAPPNTVASRPDVFIAGRQFPVPAVDWNGFSADLSTIKAQAQASGRYFGPSSAQGYQITLKTDDTFDLYRVNSQLSPPSGCTNYLSQTGWSPWSVNSKVLLGNYPFPANGLVFVEDHVWVEGTINGARLTVASGKFPENSSTNTNIIINNDLKYTNYDGQDVLALIAQGNLLVGMVSDTDLWIDAALIAKNGFIGRYYYRPPTSGQRCSPYHERDALRLYGMLASKERYGFAYTDGNGYALRNIIYDSKLLYGPPPSFPLTSDQYQTISWREL